MPKITKMMLARRRLGMSQQRLAESLVPPVTQPRISMWENGVAEIPKRRRDELSKILAVDPSELDGDA